MHEIRPIARWARVNNETVEGVEQIGVVAFHKDGIKEVRYKINTGSMGPSDLSLVLSNFGSLTTEGDLNGDGKVDAGDLSLVLANFGKEYEIVVTESRINHKTKVEEYSFDFDFSKLEYGAIVEVQATIIANNDTNNIHKYCVISYSPFLLSQPNQFLAEFFHRRYTLSRPLMLLYNLYSSKSCRSFFNAFYFF